MLRDRHHYKKKVAKDRMNYHTYPGNHSPLLLHLYALSMPGHFPCGRQMDNS